MPPKNEKSDSVFDKLQKVPGIGKELAEAFSSNFNIDKIIAEIETLDKKATSVAKNFGVGRESILAIKQGMADAVESVTLLGGNLDKIVEIQQQVSAELGRNVVFQSESYAKLYAATEVSGASAKEIVQSFKNIGVSAYNAASGVQTIIDTSRQLGANAQEVTTKVLSNMNYMNQFTFQGGVEGLAKMAAQATSLRIDMKSTLGFAEKVFDPEGAISTAAALQRLGVAQSSLLDPLKLMDLAQNDPTELQNQIVQMTQQFVQLNEKGQFEIMPGAKRQMMEIAKSMGIPYSELTKMALGTADLDKKMREITFPDVPEDKKKMIANLAEMGEGGEYVVSFTDKEGQKVTKSVSELSEGDIKLLGEASQPKTLEELAKEQLDVNKGIKAGIDAIANRTGRAIGSSKSGEDFIRASMSIAQKGGEILSGPTLSTRNIRTGIDQTIQSSVKGITSFGKGEIDLQTLLNQVSLNGEKFKDFYVKANEEISERTKKTYTELDGAQNMWIELLKSGVEKLKPILGGGGVGVTEQKDFIVTKAGVIQPYAADTIAGFTQPLQPVLNTPNNLGELSVTSNKPQITTKETTPSTEIKYSGELVVRIEAPSGIDVSQLQLALNNNLVKQQIISSIQKNEGNQLTASVA
jgi:hypothetical protein